MTGAKWCHDSGFYDHNYQQVEVVPARGHIMHRIVGAALTCAILALGDGAARAQESRREAAAVVPKGAEEVWQLEAKRRAAQIAGDLKTLEALASDELTYAHTNGMVDTKKSYLKALGSGVNYETIDVSDVSIAAYDSSVVMVGLVQIAVKSKSGPIGFRARFTSVWAKQQDRWRWVAWHTTRMPD
jgi:hypothetical protein